MDKGVLGTDVVTQIGIIVGDIEKAAREFADFFGVPVPSWMLTDAQDKALTRYRGKPTPARAKLAFLKLGNIELELIEPDTEPSTWREFLVANGEGVHHIAFAVNGMKKRLADLGSRGFPLVQAGEYTGGRYAYLDASHALKMVIELLEND